MLTEKIVTSISGLQAFLIYFGASIFLLVIFALVYAMVTPYREFRLISEGNMAAAYSYSGALLGFAIPLASSITHSVGLIDMIIWGIIALVVQTVTFLVVKLIYPAIVLDIPANQTSKGMFLGVVSVVTGVLNAACMTY